MEKVSYVTWLKGINDMIGNNHIENAKTYIEKQISIQPKIGLVLGSGLGVLADDIEDQVIISYGDIPHFPTSTVEGHAGNLVIGSLEGKSVVAMQGRFHFYEGYSMQEVTFPMRVMHALGVESVLITNAAGGINKQFRPGDLMIIEDHINLTGTNPLIGPNDEQLGPRFPDMSSVYDKQFIQHVRTIATGINMNIQTGVYVGNSGPTYETPAEINMLRMVGGDAVGMSTVPEAIVARHMGLDILGISCITNMAAGILDEQLSHEDVIQTANKAQKQFITLVKETIRTFPK